MSSSQNSSSSSDGARDRRLAPLHDVVVPGRRRARHGVDVGARVPVAAAGLRHPADPVGRRRPAGRRQRRRRRARRSRDHRRQHRGPRDRHSCRRRAARRRCDRARIPELLRRRWSCSAWWPRWRGCCAAARSARCARGSRAIAVETAVPLGERRSLVIVAVEGRRLLLGLTPGADFDGHGARAAAPSALADASSTPCAVSRSIVDESTASSNRVTSHEPRAMNIQVTASARSRRRCRSSCCSR